MAKRLVVLDWNLNWATPDRDRDKAELIDKLSWDVAFLQEVKRGTWRRLVEVGLGGVFSLDAARIDGGKSGGMGCAILVRKPEVLGSTRLLEGLPQPERGIAARLQLADLDAYVNVLSWHAPNGVSVSQDVKMSAYRQVIEFLGSRGRPILAGMDVNAWNDCPDLEAAEREHYDDSHPEYFDLLGSDPQHDCVDVFRRYLEERPELLAVVPSTGPLETSYYRDKKKTIPERFDRIFASREFAIEHVEYALDDAIAAGSDHALVRAELALPS